MSKRYELIYDIGWRVIRIETDDEGDTTRYEVACSPTFEAAVSAARFDAGCDLTFEAKART